VAGLTVLDESIIVAHFSGADAHHEDAVAILEGADGLAASTLTLAEALVQPASAGRLGEPLTSLLELGVRPVPIDEVAVATLAELRAETGLRMPDCCVLHAAIIVGADAIGTRDQRLARVAREKGLETP
jgi:predicted nucleic acid-binding protein